VVAVAAALVTTMLSTDDNPANPNHAAPPKHTTTTETTTNEPSPTTETTTTTTTTTTEGPPTTEQPPPQQQPQSPAAAITDYYALMPGNLDQAWTRLTPKFQASPAGGRSGYESFWSKIRTVVASDVAQAGDDTAEVTLLYTYNDGHRVKERHRYTLVNQNGVWLIDAVNVLSSGPA